MSPHVLLALLILPTTVISLCTNRFGCNIENSYCVSENVIWLNCSCTNCTCYPCNTGPNCTEYMDDAPGCARIITNYLDDDSSTTPLPIKGRCQPYVDSTGTCFPTKCQAATMKAYCNNDITKPMCSCPEGWTGPSCSLRQSEMDIIVGWLGQHDTDKLLEIITVAQTSPVTLVELLPLFYATLTPSQKKAISWNLDEIVEAVDYELKEVDIEVAFTPIYDDVLGTCYTFNYANKSNSFDGLYHTRYVGQSRDFSIMVKLDPMEQVSWIECSAINTYIHAPGTPPTQGVLYTLRADASDVVGLQKTITKLYANCISSVAELKKNYYLDGDYTREGCFSACYQDKVMEMCGCMDPRYKKAESASQCLFKDNDCINRVSEEYGEPSSWNSCKCPQACYQETYAISSTRSGFPFKIPNCANTTDGCPNLSQTIARLSVHLDSLESQVYVEMPKMTFITFLSQFGAQMGFLLGISVVGVIEIVVLCGTLGKDSCEKRKI